MRQDENEIIDITPRVDNAIVNSKDDINEPFIIIESDDNTGCDEPADNNEPQKKSNKNKIIAITIAVVLLVALLAVGGWYILKKDSISLPISCTPEENIEKLKAPTPKVKPEVIMTQDSVGTVVLNMYQLLGLKATISYDRPDSIDTDVFFYSLCADYDRSGKPIGSMVIDGTEKQVGNTRLGYCAMLGGNMVIGVAKTEEVRDFVVENGGSYFRQFILVSGGEIPRVFHLHGVVERRALARLADSDQLYYIESAKKETMTDFADAIRKYGFIDAIYITGGDNPSFYRTSDGSIHWIGNKAKLKPKNTSKIVPWLVFRK